MTEFYLFVLNLFQYEMQHGSKVRYKVKLRVSLKHLKILLGLEMFHDEVNELAVLKYLRTTRCLQTLLPTRSYWRTLACDTTSSGSLHWQHWPVTLLLLTVCIGNIGQWRCFLWLSVLATLASSHIEATEPTLDAWGLPKKQVCLTADSGSNCATTVYTTQNLSDILLKR